MIEKLREELIEDIINYLDKSFSSRKFLPKVQNDIMQIIVDSFDELEWSMNTNGNYKLQGTITEYLVKLVDADGEEVTYNITDYYNEDCNEIVDTRIWKLSDKILDDLQVKNDSRLGIKILGFITSEHFYRNDVLESMYVKEMEDKVDDYINREY